MEDPARGSLQVVGDSRWVQVGSPEHQAVGILMARRLVHRIPAVEVRLHLKRISIVIHGSG